MSEPQKPAKNLEKTSTTVDLGDDLLAEPTSPLEPSVQSEISLSGMVPEPDVEPIAEPELEAESQLEAEPEPKPIAEPEANPERKKLLRRILLRDPRNVAAREELKKIQEQEIAELLSQKGGRHPGATVDLPFAEESSFLDLADEAEGLQKKELELQLLSLLEDLGAWSDRELVDIGIGFREMGFFELATRTFRMARKKDGEFTRASGLLLADTLLSIREYFSAEEVLNDLIPAFQDAVEEERIEYWYLNGKVQEALGRKQNALAWYRKVRAVERSYRDLADRIRSCEGQ